MSADMTDPTVQIADDLRELETLSEEIPDEAAHRGPRPELLAMLGPVANIEAWGYIIDARDERELDTSHVEDHDPDWEPPLQTLLFWTEQWRAEHGNETDTTPTIASEAAYLRGLLQWAYDHEPRWSDLVDSVHTARARLEAQLRAGEQVERGVPCMYDECGGVRLVRKLERHGRRWVHTNWHCPRRPQTHTWDDDAYARMVTAAHQATSFEDIDGESWCTIAYAARDTQRSVKTIRTWVNEGHVRRACMVAGRRTQFVSLDDVRAQHTKAGRRKRGKGTSETYNAWHQRLNRERGKARSHDCVDCGERAAQWSYKHGVADERRSPIGSPYTLNADDYEPRCMRCHGRLDADMRRGA